MSCRLEGHSCARLLRGRHNRQAESYPKRNDSPLIDWRVVLACRVWIAAVGAESFPAVTPRLFAPATSEHAGPPSTTEPFSTFTGGPPLALLTALMVNVFFGR
jgi:hypothetical protein